MVAHWLPISAVMARLNLPLEQVQDLVEAKVLHAESIGGDHLSISAESVTDLLPPVLATPSGDDLAAADHTGEA